MIRIIDGVAYEGKAGQHFKVKAHDLGNGHLEVTASRTTQWSELDWSPSVIADHQEMIARYREEHADEVRARNAKRSASRARARVRRLCKVMAVDTMLTLTYRANQTDLALCKRHLKEFARRMVRVMPGFSFVGAFERQDRGAWHVHLATRRVPTQLTYRGKACANDRNMVDRVKVRSYDVIRSVWRSVVGDLSGNIDVARSKRWSAKTPAQIASYIAGYIVKEFAQGELWSNRWTKYGEGEVPEPVELGLVESVRDGMAVAFACLTGAHSVGRMFLSKWADVFYLSAELPPSRGRPVMVMD